MHFAPLKVLHFASRFQLLGTFGELICLEATVSEQVKLILESRTYGTPRSCTHTQTGEFACQSSNGP